MAFLIAACVGVVLDAVSMLRYLSWLAFPGFALGLAAWVWSVQMRTAIPAPTHVTATKILGIIATFFGFADIFLFFTLGSLLYGGVMVF